MMRELPVDLCEWCGDPIYPGDECYQFDGGPIYHTECLKVNALRGLRYGAIHKLLHTLQEADAEPLYGLP